MHAGFIILWMKGLHAHSFILMTGFHIEEVTIDKNVDMLSPIDEDSARISIPREVVESTIAEGAPVRIASFLFRNMTGLLPESLGDEDQNDTYVNADGQAST